MTGPEWKSQEGFYGVNDCLNTKGEQGKREKATENYLKCGTTENVQYCKSLSVI